jgi:hypothetical protein
MRDIKQKIGKFIRTPVGAVVLFVLIFYLMTFMVYYFYSPGPVERGQTSQLLTS